MRLLMILSFLYLNRSYLLWASEPPTATFVMWDHILFTSSHLSEKIELSKIVSEHIIFTGSHLREKIKLSKVVSKKKKKKSCLTFAPQLFFQPLLHSSCPQHSCLREICENFLLFLLPVLHIARRLLPPLAITFVVYVFQAADVLQIVVPFI